MNNTQFLHNFSTRLCHLLKTKGYGSSRSSAGVDVGPLADHSGASKQMARRYVLGEALPEPLTILKMSQWLNVSPGWLLYGSDNIVRIDPNDTTSHILIELNLLKILLLELEVLFKTQSFTDAVDFVLDILMDIAYVDADSSVKLKIIKMATASAQRFNSK